MAHPIETKRLAGKLWHLEDSKLPKSDATALARHLRHTEDKLARINKGESGYQVWWARK